MQHAPTYENRDENLLARWRKRGWAGEKAKQSDHRLDNHTLASSIANTSETNLPLSLAVDGGYLMSLKASLAVVPGSLTMML